MNGRLLTVDMIVDDRAKVRVHADCVLFLPGATHGANHGSYYSTPRYIEPDQIYAMSLVGSEQALRAIGASCAAEHWHQRCQLEFAGPRTKISGRWHGPWNYRAQVLTESVAHMVAIPAVTVAKDVVGEETRHVIIPGSGGGPTADLDPRFRAIYERLLLAYTTPLLPLDTAWSEPEKAAGWDWCQKIVANILASPAYWKPLQVHKEQTSRHWDNAGLLIITPSMLDTMVCAMVRSGELAIPAARKNVAAFVPQVELEAMAA